MNKLFYLLVITAFLLSSCGGNVTPPVTQPPATQPPVTQPPAITPSQQTPNTTTPSTAVVNASGCTDSAAFVSDVTVPDHSIYKEGDSILKVWRVKNTGTCTWTDQYVLSYYDGDDFGALDKTKLSTTKPGDTLDIAVGMTAPLKDGTYRADFQILNPSGAVMPIDQNTILWIVIQVENRIASSGMTPTPGAGSSSSGTGSSGGNISASVPGFAKPTCTFSVDQTKVNQTVDAINAYRAQHSLPAYKINADLVTAAQFHSEDMACNNLFYHTGSNGSTPASRIAATGYNASALTENVYGSYPPLDGQGVVTWFATDQIDPRHNENLISTKYTEFGVGYAFFNNFGYYVVDFASP